MRAAGKSSSAVGRLKRGCSVMSVTVSTMGTVGGGIREEWSGVGRGRGLVIFRPLENLPKVWSQECGQMVCRPEVVESF